MVKQLLNWERKISFDRKSEKGYSHINTYNFVIKLGENPYSPRLYLGEENDTMEGTKAMYGEREFRVVLLGGYNKSDVQEYLQTIEKDSEIMKMAYQNEIRELKAELEKIREEKITLEEDAKKYKSKAEEFENIDDIDNELKKLQNQNEELKQKIANLEVEKRLYSEENKRLEDKWDDLNEIASNSEERIQMENQIQQLREEKKRYEEDCQAIRKVLEDARLSAQYIQEEARKKAEEILEQARKESREFIEHRKMQIDKELEERGIRFMAAKYKIEAYRKEINDTQQKLYNLYSDMGKMVEEMPHRLEQLWDEEAVLNIPEKEL